MSRPDTDRRLLIRILLAAVVLVAAIIALAPPAPSDDPTPSVTNHGPAGAKAAFLTLQSLGYHATRYDGSLDDLANTDAPSTTLVLAHPLYAATDQKDLANSIERFLRRGGQVLATDADGALLLPGGSTAPPSRFHSDLCYTTPAGPGPLAATGPVEIFETSQWNGEDLSVQTDQRCNADPVVVHFAVGSGTAIWWSSARPLTNSGLHTDADFRLLLASLGNRRNILFDEALHEAVPTLWDKARGLPTGWLIAQLALIFLLTLLTFGRRSGPLRTLITRPRTSPVEFAESMGTLYARAGATSAATDAALARIHRVLRLEAGIAPAVIIAGPQAIGEALTARLGGHWDDLADHLQQAHDTEHNHLNPRSTLAIVRALHADEAQLRTALKPNTQTLTPESA